jgi:hypothetical protein
MKGTLLIAAVTLLSLSRSAIAQVPDEKMPEFIATGAVTTFDEICLKIYTDYAKANEWMKDHSREENPTSSADAYREEKADRVFLVGSSLASYVVAFGEGNRCTVYSEPGDKKTAEHLLNELMNRYATQWKTTFEQTQNEIKGRQHIAAFMANIPGTDKPILGIMVVYISMKDKVNPLIKISGVSLRRLQTSGLTPTPAPK